MGFIMRFRFINRWLLSGKGKEETENNLLLNANMI